MKLVDGSGLDYKFKYADREALKILYSQKGSADDILVVKSGLITDSYYCNVALLKNGQWHTPYLPLLHGTKRAQLLDDKLIIEEMITEHDLQKYSHIRLFNALIEFGEVELDISNLIE